jgi:Biotin-requiring enzyme
MSTDEPISLVIPRLSVNEDTVTISRIFAAPGAAVQAGDIVLSLTTSKVDVDVEAPSGGFFWPVVQVGDQVGVGAPRPPSSRPAAIGRSRSSGRRSARRRRGQPGKPSTGRPSLGSTSPRYRPDRASFASGTWRRSMRADPRRPRRLPPGQVASCLPRASSIRNSLPQSASP